MESMSIRKRGRKKKDERRCIEINKEQVKFFVDLSANKKEQEKVVKMLVEVNKKDYGKEISFKDIAVYAFNKLGEKDIEKIKEGSLSEMEKVKRALDEHNKKSGQSLDLGEYLVKKLNIN